MLLIRQELRELNSHASIRHDDLREKARSLRDRIRRDRELARQRRIDDRVHFLGEQEQVAPLLSIADAFLLPSAQESFGLAALEGMASGVVPLGTTVGGAPMTEDDQRKKLELVGKVAASVWK